MLPTSFLAPGGRGLKSSFNLRAPDRILLEPRSPPHRCRVEHLGEAHRFEGGVTEVAKSERLDDVGMLMEPFVIRHADDDSHFGAAVGDDNFVACRGHLTHDGTQVLAAVPQAVGTHVYSSYAGR